VTPPGVEPLLGQTPGRAEGADRQAGRGERSDGLGPELGLVGGGGRNGGTRGIRKWDGSSGKKVISRITLDVLPQHAFGRGTWSTTLRPEPPAPGTIACYVQRNHT
jgi:hypothetical protein